MTVPEPTYTREKFDPHHFDVPTRTYRHELSATLLTTFRPDLEDDHFPLGRPQPVTAVINHHWAYFELPGCCDVSLEMTETTCIVRIQQRNGELIEEIVVKRTAEENV